MSKKEYESAVPYLEKAVEHMKLFSKEDNVQYWIIRFFESDPMLSAFDNNPEFKKYSKDTKDRFWRMHETLKAKLEEEGLLQKNSSGQTRPW